jgi:hypothetical protein
MTGVFIITFCYVQEGNKKVMWKGSITDSSY